MNAKKAFWLITILCAILVGVALILSFLNCGGYSFGYHSQIALLFFDRITIWLVNIVSLAISAAAVSSCFYAMYALRREGMPSLFAVFLPMLACALLAWIPGNVIDEFFQASSQLGLPILFYLFFALLFITGFGYTAYFFLAGSKDLNISQRVLKLILLLFPAIIAGAFSAAYGYASVLFAWDQRIDFWERILVSIGNIVYFLAILVASLAGIGMLVALESEDRKLQPAAK